MVDLSKGESFCFLGFESSTLSEANSESGGPQYVPRLKKRTALLAKLKIVFRRCLQPTCGTGDRTDQPNSTRLGELLRGRPLEPVFFVYQPMGGTEDSAAPDACPRTPGVRVEAVE